MKILLLFFCSTLVSSIQSFIIGLQVILFSVKLGLVGNEEDFAFLEIEFLCLISSIFALIVISKWSQLDSKNIMTTLSSVMLIGLIVFFVFLPVDILIFKISFIFLLLLEKTIEILWAAFSFTIILDDRLNYAGILFCSLFFFARISYFGGINSFILILEGLEFSMIYPISLMFFIIAIICCTSPLQDKLNQKSLNLSDPATFSQILRCPLIISAYTTLTLSSFLYYIVLINQEKSLESLSISKFYIFYILLLSVFLILSTSFIFFTNCLNSRSCSSIGLILIAISLILSNFFIPAKSTPTSLFIWLLASLGFLISSLSSIIQVFFSCCAEMQFTNQAELYLKLCGLNFFAFGLAQASATAAFYFNSRVLGLNLLVVLGVLAFVVIALREVRLRGVISYERIYRMIKWRRSKEISVSEGGLDVDRP